MCAAEAQVFPEHRLDRPQRPDDRQYVFGGLIDDGTHKNVAIAKAVIKGRGGGLGFSGDRPHGYGWLASTVEQAECGCEDSGFQRGIRGSRQNWRP